MSPEFKSMYYQVYQYHITSFMRKHLCEGDVFVDVGANIGYMTAYALGLIGPSGQVHAFEPVPTYFEKLQRI